MKNAGFPRRLLVAALCLFAVDPLHAKPPPTARGHYADWDGGTLDDVTITQPFHLHDFNRILVLPIDTAALELPTDNTRVPVQKTLAKSTAQLDDELPNRLKVKAQPTSADVSLNQNPGTLLLRARFSEMNPGSSSARVFSLGFAGATHITMQGEILDGGTGKVLVRFSHHNYHSKAGLINKYTAALEENEEQIAGSVAELIKAFYP